RHANRTEFRPVPALWCPHVFGQRQGTTGPPRADVRSSGTNDGDIVVTAVRDQDIAGPMRRIEALVRSLETCGDAVARECARELVRTVLDLHAAGLAKLLELAARVGDSGSDLVERFARDPLVSSLLLLHGLHPVPVERRVADALERVRPRLHPDG